jgi:hypothetical protein
MKIQFAILAAMLSTSSAVLAADGTFDKTLSVNGSATLNVSTGSGYIHITSGSDSQIHIVGHVRANRNWIGGGSPEETVKEILSNPPIDQTGSIVRVGKMKDDWRNVSIDYDITTPRATQLTASAGSGNLKVQGIQGATKLETGSGSIEASGVGGNLNLEAGSGSIHAEQAGPGEVKAETGSGSIYLDNVQGGLDAETGSGSIEVSGKPVNHWKLETGSGSVTMKAGNSPFSLDASTGSGTVHSDPPMIVDGDLSKHHVKGKVNGGGPEVRIETGSGSISVRE